MPQQLLTAYFCLISLIAVLTAVSDKRRAERHRYRVPERTLLLISALGGSAAMFLTLLAIRHKTRRKKFMIGIPAILFAQISVFFFLARWF